MSIEIMVGLTFVRIERTVDTLVFHSSDGRAFKFYHFSRCCESVEIESITGDLDDLIGEPLLMAEESSNSQDVSVYKSETWTFYKFATRKGYVDVRWYGTSNGYYSENVDFEVIDAA